MPDLGILSDARLLVGSSAHRDDDVLRWLQSSHHGLSYGSGVSTV